MTTTVTELVNLALDRLDAPAVMSLEAPTTGFEKKLKRSYPHFRDMLLRRYVWNFAKAATYLTRLSPDLEGDEPRKYRFALPTDCLHARRKEDAGRLVTWEIRGREILHDGTTLYLHYTRRIEDVSMFDSLFVEALSLQLAMAYSETVTGNATKKEQAAAMLKEALAEARLVNAIENDTPYIADSDAAFSFVHERYR